MTEQNHIRWEQGADGIVVLTMDAPGRSANTMNAAFVDALAVVVQRLEAEKESITGVVITSAKKTFFAGGDLDELIRTRPEDAADSMAFVTRIKSLLRRLETLGRPVVAAINGGALGGGLEIALSCHHRIALDAKGSLIGLPEVSLGLLPGAGGVVRTVRLLGITNALSKVLQGQRHRPAEALEIGLVHELVTTPEELLARARQWAKENPEAVQPWDVKGYKIPGGTPATPAFAAGLPAFPANLRKQLGGADYPAPRNILAAAVESAQVDLDTAFTIESRYFVELVTGQIAKNMTQAFFFDLRHINSGGSRPDGHDTWRARKVAVLGAGMMGAGIAYACARGGMQVVLKDVSAEAAEKGKGYSVKLLEKAVARGRATREQAEGTLARITPTADPGDLTGCDLVIEAVFESPELKQKVFQETEDIVEPGALLGSNTSTLPITGLAEAVKDQENFIGLHFFSPVDKMPLLEIVVGQSTSDAALAKAIDLAKQIGKTPIVVNDSRGFFTSRVITRFLDEAVAMVGEGIHPASIEQAARQAGYPAPPLQLMDELTLTLPRKIREEFKAAVLADGRQWQAHGSEAVIDRMIDAYDRRGRASGAGFYEYADGRRTGLWPGLIEHFTKPGPGIPFEDMQQRMLFAEAVDTVRCFDEGVLRSVPDANIGSLFGIGFPAWTGGVIQYINQYDGGPAGFVARARELAEKYGDHFTPPASLVEKADKGELLT
ncbi:3-hydroxyacyl-CoA dehydrogenase NAD-binding domain-containing protein [Streptomyces ipomoeae]|uniref:3-hydroxyacyl-CoA dehydrogenase NAD-binding domain-containing protein n=1 Tax=Streptomyces ipomoeae TaxID=103232 RepID=UPI0011465F77|nr:3-hydroxyacyl-CoA dehydrogenase NAD-binding domain-containing protein [Streptomyces ipomoeae]MDX2937651.1 3-hydroxyacyl-CoA dehydrogenase NAD-binding domain-containing protein [Streptomyces ipomoeae]TQE22790.1 3-hydroxyacyl-CoA dehydrogenase [Streptomyces ipomoeae]